MLTHHKPTETSYHTLDCGDDLLVHSGTNRSQSIVL